MQNSRREEEKREENYTGEQEEDIEKKQKVTGEKNLGRFQLPTELKIAKPQTAHMLSVLMCHRLFGQLPSVLFSARFLCSITFDPKPPAPPPSNGGGERKDRENYFFILFFKIIKTPSQFKSHALY